MYKMIVTVNCFNNTSKLNATDSIVDQDVSYLRSCLEYLTLKICKANALPSGELYVNMRIEKDGEYYYHDDISLTLSPDYESVTLSTFTSCNDKQTIKIKYFHNDLIRLKAIGDKSDWIDMRSAENIPLSAGEDYIIKLGVAMQLPNGYEAHIRPRSSSFKTWGFIPIDGGVIDNLYCGDNDEWFLHVYATRSAVIKFNDRICQFRIVKKQPSIIFEDVKILGNKDRGGHGSTGIK